MKIRDMEKIQTPILPPLPTPQSAQQESYFFKGTVVDTHIQDDELQTGPKVLGLCW